ncbi:MAG: TrmO family methyltransferase [Candidatus Thiodiazotropha sp.]
MPARQDSLKSQAPPIHSESVIIQVHPRDNPENPLWGFFTTRAPVRPNPITLSRCQVISIEDNSMEIDDIDAFPDTPVLDIKP